MKTLALSEPLRNELKRGVVIPALPLALDARRKLDERRQAALCRYYCAAGAGGVAAAVHTTQFEIRQPGIDLLMPVLRVASAALDEAAKAAGRPLIKIAGVCGPTPQAVSEAELAASLGYHLAMPSLGALREASEDELVAHCRQISRILPLMGFYLQPAVGGRILPHSFWRRFLEIENVLAIKVAPFNRYQTLDVVRALALSGREREVTLYTGNDDNIIVDLLTPYRVQTSQGPKTIRVQGGLLGQWAIWTRRAVELLEEIHGVIAAGNGIPPDLLARHAGLTDANAAVFDAAHGFAGCIPGINEVLRRQGLFDQAHCLDPRLGLSPGQAEEIERAARDHPWLVDDAFVREHLREWLR